MTTLACPLDRPGGSGRPERRQGRLRPARATRSTSRAARSRTVGTAGAVPAPPRPLRLHARDAAALPALEPTPLERQERLEQLRALEHGVRIRVCADRPRRCSRSTRPRTSSGRSALVAARSAMTRVEIAEGVDAGDGQPLLAHRRPVRRRGRATFMLRIAETLTRDRRAPRRRPRLQVVVRQGEPLVGATRPAGPGSTTGSRSSPRSRRELGVAGGHRHPRDLAGRAGGRGRRRAPDPGVPLPPDRPARRGRRRPAGRSTSRRASSSRRRTWATSSRSSRRRARPASCSPSAARPSATTTSSSTSARCRSCARSATRSCSTPPTASSIPGGLGTASGGQREYVPHLARAAAAVGIDALFVEVHERPGHGAERRAEHGHASTRSTGCWPRS